MIDLNADVDEETTKPLFNIQISEGGKTKLSLENYSITSLKTSDHNDKLWRVIWSLKPDGHRITSHDIIKVGWMKFKVREFWSQSQYFNIEEHGDQEEFEETKNVEDVPEEELHEMCRFCWVNEYTEQNPKIGTCNCIGTVKYIHYECLKAWL